MSQPEDAAQPRRSELLHSGFTAVPNLVLLRTDLSGNAKTLYAIMLDVIQYQREEPTIAELGDLLGAKKQAVFNAQKELVDSNLLVVRRRGQGKPNEYTLLEPESLNSRNRSSRTPETSGLTKSLKTLKQDTLSLKRERPRDEVWDTLVELLGAAPEGRMERGRWNKAAQSLREAGATPPLIRLAAKSYRTLPSYRECSMTPTALAANWTILTATPKTATELQLEQTYAKMRQAEALHG